MRKQALLMIGLLLLLVPHVGQSTGVSPSNMELSGSRGESIESTFDIINTEQDEQVYFLGVLAFSAEGEDGTPTFTQEDEAQTPFLSWIHFPVKEVVVPGQSKVDVPFKVVVPDDVPAGSYHGAITVSTVPSDVVASNGAIVMAKTAILVFVAVEGETVEKLTLLDFEMSQRDGTLPFGTFTYRLQNQGNVHLMPEGNMTLRGFFGQTIAVVGANDALGRILPSSTRAYTVNIGPADVNWFEAAGYQLKHLLLGPVQVDLNLAYGQEGLVRAQTTVWVMPWQLITVLLGGCLVGVLFYKKMAT